MYLLLTTTFIDVDLDLTYTDRNGHFLPKAKKKLLPELQPGSFSFVPFLIKTSIVFKIIKLSVIYLNGFETQLSTPPKLFRKTTDTHVREVV